MPSHQNQQSTDLPTTIPADDVGLNLSEIGSLFIAMSNYESEADTCYNAGAYLANCVMLAATIEGYLVILTSVFPEEAQQALQQLQKAKQIGTRLRLSSVLRWHLGELLQVAKQANWLPSFDPDDASNPLSTDRIQELRNLIHPGRLVKDRGGRTITKKELDTLHATCDAVALPVLCAASASTAGAL
ncbi:MAG TPA: hypothetical protein VN957_11585 [Chthoniobacterales bacterium]|jgi:hypothetical protein|nr:hypothetical protein [Chthoniobacterales bacterium]